MKRPALRACISLVWPTACRRIFWVGSLVRVCALPGLSRAPSFEMLQVSCGKGWHSSSGESGCSSPIASPVSESWISGSQTGVGRAEGSWSLGWGGQQGNRRVFVVLNARMNHRLSLKFRPPCRQLLTEKLSPHPLLLSPFRNIDVSGPRYYGKAKQWAICKQNHVCRLEADNIFFSLPSLFPLSSLHPGQGNCL